MVDIDQFLTSGTIMSMKCGTLLVGWGKRHWYSNPKDAYDPLFYFPDFFITQQKPWFSSEHCVKISISALKAGLEKIRSTSLRREWQMPHKEHFQNSFQELQSHFLCGELKKAVPYVLAFHQQPMNKEQLHASLCHLLTYLEKAHAYIYGFWDANEGILGATPEILFHKEGKKLHTVACAGTANSATPSEDLLRDPKEFMEHQWVVDGICESLLKFGELKVGEKYVLSLPKLKHLVTPISLEKTEASFEQVIEALHPTPALGAFPRAAGHMWLRNYHDKIPRGRYGAPAGFTHNHGEESSCYVAIRNVQWNHQHCFIGAGCGVVSSSSLEREWQEIELKLQTIKEMLSI